MADRAEERALEAYPEKITAASAGGYAFSYDMNQQLRTGYIKGYHQAEKDILFNNEKYHTVQVSILDELYDIKKKYEAEKDLAGEFTASDRGMVDEIIVNLKRIENDYQIDLTKEMEWLRGVEKKKCKVIALTWEDMILIHRCIKDAMNYNLYKMMEGVEGQKEVYQNVLKRFLESKRV